MLQNFGKKLQVEFARINYDFLEWNLALGAVYHCNVRVKCQDVERKWISLIPRPLHGCDIKYGSGLGTRARSGV